MQTRDEDMPPLNMGTVRWQPSPRTHRIVRYMSSQMPRYYPLDWLLINARLLCDDSDPVGWIVNRLPEFLIRTIALFLRNKGVWIDHD